MLLVWDSSSVTFWAKYDCYWYNYPITSRYLVVTTRNIKISLMKCVKPLRNLILATKFWFFSWFIEKMLIRITLLKLLNFFINEPNIFYKFYQSYFIYHTIIFSVKSTMNWFETHSSPNFAILDIHSTNELCKYKFADNCRTALGAHGVLTYITSWFRRITSTFIC